MHDFVPIIKPIKLVRVCNIRIVKINTVLVYVITKYYISKVRRQIMDDYRVVKGEEGERYVGEILKNVLLRMDYEYRLVQNTYLPFKSVYGEFGYISAEFDFTVFTPLYLFAVFSLCFKSFAQALMSFILI